ncbi:hypothetical protein AMTR_s00116p00092180 [Amborella trichopoda]|uniref:Uncharacterized protein n=1 Tax=Amborella trichopoda TaxID=13333 RepID=W1NNY1_AMBTC|nr:hypothetical protein AMTR_s00116p00092180 [Amborella trichopoda]
MESGEEECGDGDIQIATTPLVDDEGWQKVGRHQPRFNFGVSFPVKKANSPVKKDPRFFRARKKEVQNLKIRKHWIPMGRFPKNMSRPSLNVKNSTRLSVNVDGAISGPRYRACDDEGVRLVGTPVGSLNRLGGGPSFPKLSTFPKLQATPLKAVDEAFQKLCWFLLTAIVVSAGHHLRSEVAPLFLLVVLGKMYPLMHRHVASKGRPSQRSSVDPSKINPLVIVLVDEVQQQAVLEDGENSPRVGVNGERRSMLRTPCYKSLI